VNGVIYNASNDTVTFNNLNNNDTIQLLLVNNSSCSITDSVYSNEIVIHYTQPIVSFVSGQLMSTPAVSYQWFYNNVFIPGAMNQSYVPTHTGNYFVRATDASGCTYASDIYYFFSVNIDDPYLNSLKIYPNPADENLMVSGIKGKIQISITDLSGRIVKKTGQSETTEVVTIKTDDIKTGYYLLKVISDNRQKFYPVQIFHRDK
jgi:hypothetical protein